MSNEVLSTGSHATGEAYIDHGVPVKSDETRTTALSKNISGEYFLVAFAKGYLININLNKGIFRQTFFPEGYVEYPFSSFCSSKGLVYTGAGRMFMEFNPSKNKFTYYSFIGAKEEIVGFGFAEDPDGCIYFSTYPTSRLLSFNPDTKEIIDFGSMDNTQMYSAYIAVDAKGWVYLGIGTERRNLVAFNPKTNERRQLCVESDRKVGSGYVHTGENGEVYGHAELEYLSELKIPRMWYRLFNGEALEIAHNEVLPSLYYGSGFEVIHSPFIDSVIIKSIDLAEHELVYMNPITRKRTVLNLNYETEGANLSPIVAAHDGKLYGTSNHPLHFFSYDPKLASLTDFGGRAIEKGGGGNICAYAVQGSILAGAAYSGGFLHLFDTLKPVNMEPGENRNPALKTIHEEIHRPRCAVAHTDGQNIIYGGFAGYGKVGGALCIYNIATEQDTLIRNEALLPYQSTMCMRVLKNGNIIAGTSVNSPGGAKPKVNEAEIYIMDWQTRELIYHAVPIEREPEISLMEIDNNQLVHCLTSKSFYFVIDPESKDIVCSFDLSGYGEIVRDGLTKWEDGKIYGAFSKAVFAVDPETFKFSLLSIPPVGITAGIGIVDGRLYFGSGSHLWSYQLPMKR